jgi:hypothetical protein
VTGVTNASRPRGVTKKQFQFHFHSVLGYRLIRLHLNSALPMKAIENERIVSKTERLVRGASYQHLDKLDDGDTTDDS